MLQESGGGEAEITKENLSSILKQFTVKHTTELCPKQLVGVQLAGPFRSGLAKIPEHAKPTVSIFYRQDKTNLPKKPFLSLVIIPGTLGTENCLVVKVWGLL